MLGCPAGVRVPGWFWGSLVSNSTSLVLGVPSQFGGPWLLKSECPRPRDTSCCSGLLWVDGQDWGSLSLPSALEQGPHRQPWGRVSPQ